MKKQYLSFLLMLTILVTFLSACTTMPAGNPPYNQQIPWKTRQQQLKQIRSWAIDGLIALQNDHQRQSANVTWLQKDQDYTISVFGPLGLGGAVLQGNPNIVTLEQADGKKVTAKTPEALIEKTSQWLLPVSNLYYWVRGLPAPTLSQNTKFDQYNHITELQQQGWHIDYRHYTGVNGQDLPSEILLERKPLRIRLVISHWKFPKDG